MSLKFRPRSTFTERPMRILLLLNTPLNDWLGRDLIRELKNKNPNITFFGTGGALMRHAGLSELPGLPVDLNFQALTKTSRAHVFKYFFYKKYLIQYALEKNIDAVITINSAPMFLPLIKTFNKKFGLPCFHYGDIPSPRIRFAERKLLKDMRSFQEVFCFYPSQAKALQKQKVKASFLGHPLLSHFAEYIPSGESKPLNKVRKLALLPSGKERDFKKAMSVMADVATKLRTHYEHLEIVLPIEGSINPRYFEPFSQLKAHYVRGEEKYLAMSQCDVALTMSGENNLPLALFGVPMVSIKESGITATLHRLFTEFFSQRCGVNVGIAHKYIPEISEKNKALLHQSVKTLLENSDMRKQQLVAFKEVRQMLQSPDEHSVSKGAAAQIHKTLSKL